MRKAATHHVHQRHVAVNTSEAVGRILRALTDTLRSAKVYHAESLLESLSRLGGFACAHSKDIDEHLNVLCDLIDTPCAKTRALALRALVHALRALPTRTVASHLLPLARSLASAARARAPAPTTLLTLAAVVTAAAPLRAHSADPLAAAVVDLALARITEPHPDALRPSLCIALSCIATAPSLVRPRIPVLTATCRTALHSSCASTRATAVLLAARLVLARSPKGRPAAAAELIAEACSDLEQIVAVFTRYSTRASKTAVDVDVLLYDHSERQLAFRFNSLCELIPFALTQPAAIPADVPVARILTALLSALRIANINPVASPKSMPRLEPEHVLAVLPALHESALKALSALFLAVGAGNALPCTSIATSALSDVLLDYCVETDAPIETALIGMRARTALYTAVTSLIHSTSTAAALQLARVLDIALNVDVQLLIRLNSARNRDVQAAVGLGRTDGSSLGGNARKRRRARGAAVEAAAAVSVSADGPPDSFGENALVVAITAVAEGIRVAGALLGAGTLADRSQRRALRAIERVLSVALTIPYVRSEALSALSAAVLSAGSGATHAGACTLLPKALLVIDRIAKLTHGENVELTTAALDSLLHPRAPYIVRIPKGFSSHDRQNGSLPGTSVGSRQLTNALEAQGWCSSATASELTESSTTRLPSASGSQKNQPLTSPSATDVEKRTVAVGEKRVRFSDEVSQAGKQKTAKASAEYGPRGPINASLNVGVPQDTPLSSKSQQKSGTSTDVELVERNAQPGKDREETKADVISPGDTVQSASDEESDSEKEIMEVVSGSGTPDRESGAVMSVGDSSVEKEGSTALKLPVAPVEKPAANVGQDIDMEDDVLDEDAMLKSLVFEKSDEE